MKKEIITEVLVICRITFRKIRTVLLRDANGCHYVSQELVGK